MTRGNRSDDPGEIDSLGLPRPPFDEPDFFRQLVANTSEGLLTIDEGSTILFANPAIEEILGYAPEELVGRSKMTIIPERLRPAHAAGLEKYIRTGEKHIDWGGIELPALHRDGHEVPVLVSLREHRLSGRRVFTGLFRDISERKHRERRFEAVFNNTFQFTGLLEPDGTLIEANETAIEFAGIDRDDIVGKPIWETFWFQSNEQARAIAKEGVERARDGEFFRREVRIRGVDRTAIIDFSIRPMTDSQDDVQLLVLEGRDITDLKLREQHLQLLHRLLRHNLRNDLNVISGFAETLESELEHQKHAAYAAEIVAAARELIGMNETAKQLADATLSRDRIQRSIALDDVLVEVVSDLRDRYPSGTVSVTGRLESTVAADRRLHTVLSEILENAIVHARNDDPLVEISVAEFDETIGVVVADNGPGIPETERTGIFNEEPVTQMNHGSGLGLWLVELILDDYGGFLEYEPRSDGDGSRVTIHLPRPPTDA
ncbi:PAS domain S-box protein [Natrarchaeobius halalkaliphilus]|uniref:histidine kinase n=1 Tax=Natrarchaeobius halalkaliphilus TaxID=1679091 RepID=A0A3N6LSP0_9EURY|nr:PAS domain S-box protein [Natrarchaeobius halalkaliphilus]RQG92983.1 PAS domain S-box protein [Natrarchaeobius halalkaliphilus]